MQCTRRGLILEANNVGSEEKSDETQLVVLIGCAAALRSRDSPVAVFSEDAVGALETEDCPVIVQQLQARTSESGVFVDDSVNAL